MRINVKRLWDEFFLYSSQFIAFFIIMLAVIPSVDAPGPLALIIVVFFLIVQTILLADQGHKPVLRALFSLITPAAYSLMRAVTVKLALFDMADVFLWAASIYIGLFQATALAARNRWIKRAAEALLALGAVLIFVVFYFYLDLRIQLASRSAQSPLSQADYLVALDIRSFPPAFLAFLRSPKNIFMVFGVATFGLLLLGGKVTIINLRARIARLFNDARQEDSSDEPGRTQGQQSLVTVISADIKNFTGLSAKVSPEKAVAILNRYYSLWSVAAEKHQGRVAGTSGDSVILAFGLSNAKDAAERALACARDFLAELPELKSDLSSASLPAPEAVSIGIHSGFIIAGELGAPGARRLGVFGDAVSVAARLDSLCREFKQDLIVSQPAFRQLSLESQASLTRLGEVLLRNSTQPVPVYGIK